MKPRLVSEDEKDLASSGIARFGELIGEAGVLAAVVLVPVCFNVYSNRIFDADKVALLRSIGLLLLLTWVLQWLTGGRQTLLRLKEQIAHLHGIPLVVAAFTVLGAALLATLLSILPRISFWGSYARQRGLFTLVSYLVVFFTVLHVFRRREQIERLWITVIVTSVPIALYGIAQHQGLDPVPWSGEFGTRVGSTMGNPIFLGAYLIMVIPLTIARLVREKESSERSAPVFTVLHGLALLLQLTCLTFTQSRGPVLGLLAGLFFFMMLHCITRRRRKAAAVALLVATISTSLLPTFVFRGEDSASRDLPLPGRVGRGIDLQSPSIQYRILVWEGAAELLASNPRRTLTGYGPDTIQLAYRPYAPPALLRISREEQTDRAHNAALDVLITTGAVGVACWVFLAGCICTFVLHKIGLLEKGAPLRWFIGAMVMGAVAGTGSAVLLDGSLRLLPVVLPLGLVGGVGLYVSCLALIGFRSGAKVRREEMPSSLLIGLFSALLAHFVEGQFGIGTATTGMMFWVYVAWLVVEGQPENIVSIDRSSRRSSPVIRSGNRILVPALILVAILAVALLCLRPIVADVYYRDALRATERGQWDRAGKMYANALRLAPRQDVYHLFHGRALMQQAKVDPARRGALFVAANEAMDRARQLNPLDLTYTANLALLERTRAQFTTDPAERHTHYLRSLDWMRPVIERAPNDGRMLDEVALTHYLMGDFDQALSTCETALAVDPEFAPTHALMGDVCMALKDWKGAIRSYERALDLDPEQVQAWSGIGYAQVQLRHWEQAAAAYKEAVRVVPQDYSARRNLALALSEAGRYQEALHHAQQILPWAPPEDRAMLEGLIKELQAALR